MKQIKKIAPNNLQLQIAKVIHSIVNVEDVDFKAQSALGYGLSNYIAKYSLAKDFYLVSKQAELVVEKIFTDKNSVEMLRGVKNNFPITYEHAIPVNLIRNELLILENKSFENVLRILSESDIVVIITRNEDNSKLSGHLKSNMPEFLSKKWSNYISKCLSRYEESKIELLKEKQYFKLIKMKGAILR